MGDTQISNKNFNVHRNQEATHLSNSKGDKTDRTDIVKLVGNENVNGRVNQQYLIALASNEIIQVDKKPEGEKTDNYKPFWSRQVAVKIGDTDNKVQYALLNRNSLIKRLAMDEAKLNEHINKGTVDDYIRSRLSELDHIKSCYREANPMPDSRGERQLRLDLAAQFPLDNRTNIQDERSQFCVALKRIEIRKEDAYCAGWNEIAVKVGTTDGSHEYAILNRDSLIKRLGYGLAEDQGTFLEQLKDQEKKGNVHTFIKSILRGQQNFHRNLNSYLCELAKPAQIDEKNLRPTIKDFVNACFSDDKDLLSKMDKLDKLPSNEKLRNDFLSHLTSKLWWTVPPEDLNPEQAAKLKPPARITLKEPTIIPEWDEEGKYTLSAVHDFISERPGGEPKEDEVTVHGSFNMQRNPPDGVKGWVTYKREDLKHLGFTNAQIYKVQDQNTDFLTVLNENLEKLHKKVILNAKFSALGNTPKTAAINELEKKLEVDSFLSTAKGEGAHIFEDKRDFIEKVKKTFKNDAASLKILKDLQSDLTKYETKAFNAMDHGTKIFKIYTKKLNSDFEFKIRELKKKVTKTQEPQEISIIEEYPPESLIVKIDSPEGSPENQINITSVEAREKPITEEPSTEILKAKNIEEFDQFLKDLDRKFDLSNKASFSIEEKREIVELLSENLDTNNKLNYNNSNQVYLNNIYYHLQSPLNDVRVNEIFDAISLLIRYGSEI